MTRWILRLSLVASLPTLAIWGAETSQTAHVAAPAQAASASTVSSAPVLSLTAALSEAAARAPGAAIAAARIAQARALQVQARALLLPTVSATGGLTSAWDSRQPYRGRSDETLTGEAGLTVRLFDGTAFPAIAAAKSQYGASEHAGRDLRRSTAFTVASSYLTVLTVERLLGVAHRRLEVAQQLLEEARARFKAGLAIASDVTRAEVEVASGQLSITKANRAIAVGRFSLQAAMGGLEPGVLENPAIAAPAERPIAELLAEASQRRDDLAAARRTVESGRSRIDVIRRGNWPVLGARAGVRDSDSNAPRIVPQSDPEWYAGLTANWTLWDGGLRSGRIQEQEGVVSEQRANVRERELTVEREIRSAVVDIQAAETAVLQAEVLSRSAAADAADVLARYRAGTATATELADAQLRSAEADADLEQRRIDVLSSRLTLSQALGYWPLTMNEP